MTTLQLNPSLSNYAINTLIDQVWRGQAALAPATIYAALISATAGIYATSTGYTTGKTMTVLASDGLYHLYYATVGGTSAASATTFPGLIGETVTDGSVTWVEQTPSLMANTYINEPTIGTYGYARVAIASSLANWAGTQSVGSTTASSGTGGQTSNNNTITFPSPSGGDWTPSPAVVFGIAFYDASTAGNLIMFGPVDGPAAVLSASPAPVFSASNARISFDIAYTMSDGVTAIYAAGYSSNYTSSYTFAGATSAISTNLLTAIGAGAAAASIAPSGVFFGMGAGTVCNLFTYSGALVTATTSLTSGMSIGYAAGNKTEAIVALGASGVTTNKFTYSGATCVTATNLTGPTIGMFGVGAAVEAIFGAGIASTPTCKYMYAGDTVSSGTSLSHACFYGTACGNVTYGFVACAGGSGSTITNTYTYSGDVVASGTSLNNSSQLGAAAGNSTVGVIAVGNGANITNTVTYAGQTIATTTSLVSSSLAESGGAGMSNGINGITI